VVPIHLPALRERVEDIPRLAEHFLATTAGELGLEPKRLSPEALKQLEAFSWPGNVRELENLCRRLTLMAPGPVVYTEDLPPDYRQGGQTPEEAGDQAWQAELARWARSALQAGETDIGATAQAELERTLIRQALAHTRGHRQQAAHLLGWGRNTLTRKIRELGLEA
jgi:two-component system nitrogen regulation response regulator GlnG